MQENEQETYLFAFRLGLFMFLPMHIMILPFYRMKAKLLPPKVHLAIIAWNCIYSFLLYTFL